MSTMLMPPPHRPSLGFMYHLCRTSDHPSKCSSYHPTGQYQVAPQALPPPPHIHHPSLSGLQANQVLSCVQMDKNRPGTSMKPFDIPVLPLMTQNGPPGTLPHSASSVAGISSGLGGMSLSSSAQPNQASMGQHGQAQGGYSPLGEGQHGHLPQAGQGQYAQGSQAGQGQYGQPNQAGQGQYGQAGQGQYGQGNQAGQGQYGQGNQAGQYGQPNQAGQGQYGQPNQAGQPPGGFDTYPDMSNNSQPFDGNQPYGGNPTTSGANPYSSHQQQQQPYQALQGNSGSYAAYPSLGNGKFFDYNRSVVLMLTVPAM